MKEIIKQEQKIKTDEELIKRIDVLDTIKRAFSNYDMAWDKQESVIKDVTNAINAIPVIFDLESVVKQLEENKKDAIRAIEENSSSEFQMIKIKDLKELFEEYTQEQIKIVKFGIISKQNKCN